MTEQNRFSFEKGYSQVPLGKAKAVKKEIMEMLGITTNPNWLKRLRGEVEPRITEKEGVEKVFRKYGIKKVWKDDK